jgi:hypothetical protein
MSPDEFALHPNAIFHGTWLPDNQLFDLSKRTPQNGSILKMAVPKIHLGTFAAALEALHTTLSDRGAETGTIHTFWQTPHVPTLGGGMKSVNNSPENMAHFLPGSMWYVNQVEDPLSPSFATEEPEQTLKSQSDYVKEAISNGKISEVNPETLKRYQSGTLGKMRLSHFNVKSMFRHVYGQTLMPSGPRNLLGAYSTAGPNWKNLGKKGLVDLPDTTPSKKKGK